MKFALTILFVMGSIMIALYSKFKRVLAEQEGWQDAQSEKRPDEDTNDFFSFEDEGEKVVVEQPSYFTYEAPVAEQAQPRPFKANKQPVFVEETAQMGFDLRQAVIYQTILNNNYIREINQQNQ